MEDLIKYCRYYKGETECPQSIVQKEMENIWMYESMWVDREELRDEKEFNPREYIQFGLKDFNAEDGTPITLKALLFNRYCHWLGGYSIEEDTENFKQWYRDKYLALSK